METDVIGNDAQQPGVPQGQGNDDKVTISKTELDSLHRQLKETQQSEREWANVARRGAAPAVETVVTEEDEALDPSEFVDPNDADIPENDTPDQIVADIASKGVKAITDRGFVTAAQARQIAVEAAQAVGKQLVGRERTKNTIDQKIINEFPELKDQNSELFKETAARFKEAVAIDPRSAKNPGALFIAAKAAKESIEHKRAATRQDPDDEDEQDRQLRARSQDGRPTGRAQIADDDMLGSEAKQVISLMGITEDQFKASRKELASAGRRR